MGTNSLKAKEGDDVVTRRVASILVGALTAILAVAVVGCSPRLPSEPPGITGTITEITSAGDGVRALVVGGEQPGGAVSDRAMVTIDDSTEVVKRDGKRVGRESLGRGVQVEVWFEGPVAESYPVQGTASFVRILD